MNNDLVLLLFHQINEAITAATVIVAASMLLYNLTRGIKDRVARSSSALLACVTVIYICNVFVAIGKTPGSIESWLRVKWIGIAFAPAALFHLSDALLATTGLVSRGRRRRVVRLLYVYGIVFLVLAAFTNLIVRDLILEPTTLQAGPPPMMQAGPLFILYVCYFIAAIAFSFNNVLRARRRCLTRTTHRRMTYLLLALITPAAGIFPYTLLFSQPSTTNGVGLWVLINLGNLGIILMLAFMAYPLSFFGPNKPDRVIKAELLHFMLRGPVLAIIVLLVIMWMPKLSMIGFPGVEFMPFTAVATVLLLQWTISLGIPFLERKLIYTEDQEQARQIQELSQRLRTPADARQLLEAILAAICNYLRVSSAFVASVGPNGFQFEQTIGPLQPPSASLMNPDFVGLLNNNNANNQDDASNNGQHSADFRPIIAWQSFWLVPLYSTRGNNNQQGRLMGVMGIWARSALPTLQPEEAAVFKVLCAQITRVLDDMRLQQEVFTRLEDVFQDTTVLQTPDLARVGYKAEIERLTKSIVDQPDFSKLIKEALRDYWGGPHLTDERLLQLKVVEQALVENEGNSTRAVRAVLTKVIARLKPEGPRGLAKPEWALYNILDLRFVQRRKVRDVYPQLAMSEADFYRKQNHAIDRVASEVAEMEHRALSTNGTSSTTG